MARLSLCLLFAGTSLAVSALVAPAARAGQLESLVLSKTSPPSEGSAPASSTEPLIFGGEEGGTTAAIRFAAGSGRPVVAGTGSNNEVSIYTDSRCEGPVLETGTLEDLEETGIKVKVAENAETTFYAIQSDGIEEPSKCSAGLTYWEGTTGSPLPNESPGGEAVEPNQAAVPAAPHLRTVPGHRANDDTPVITGDAPGAGTVKIFSGSSCSGAPVVSGSAADFGAGLQVQVADNTATTFTGISVSAGRQSACSAPVTYVEDSTPPRTRITMGPGVKTRKHKAVFRFADTTEDPPGTNFFCKVNHGKWKQCSSPFKLRHLRTRGYVLRVKATDIAGNAEAKGAKRRFRVIR